MNDSAHFGKFIIALEVLKSQSWVRKTFELQHATFPNLAISKLARELFYYLFAYCYALLAFYYGTMDHLNNQYSYINGTISLFTWAKQKWLFWRAGFRAANQRN